MATRKPDETLTDNDRRFADSAGLRLRQDADALDPRLAQRLVVARRAAVAGVRPAAPGLAWRRFAPAGAMAVAVLAVSGVVLQMGLPGRAPLPLAETESDDLEIVLAEESLDLYEDLAFYRWLAVERDAG